MGQSPIFEVPDWHLKKIRVLEKKYDEQFRIVFEAIYKVMAPPEKKKGKIGFGRE